MLVLIILFILIDVISKILIKNNFVLFESKKIIGEFFKITYVKNTGVAFSAFRGYKYFIIGISILIIMGIIWYLYKNKGRSRIENIGYSLILGGSFGNLIDRLLYGYVVDFLDFNIFGYDYPIFNIADSFIFIGVIILVFGMWRCK